MKNSLVLTFVICFLGCFLLQAQDDKYTYLTDKKFRSSEDLFGYTFVPGLLEVAKAGQTAQGEQQEISAGSYKFGVTRGNLFVKGKGIDGVHNINQINATDYGYKLILMNARDPKQQGHLKIIKLKSFVDALVFKASNDAQELIFLLPEIGKELQESEKKYFTDRNEIELEFEEDIWGLELNPFFKTFMPKRVYQRVQKSDNVKISFIETEKTKNKGNKSKDVVLLMNEEPKEEVTEVEEVAPAPVEEIVEEVIVEEEEEEEDDTPLYFSVKKKKKKPVVEEVVEEVEEIIEEEEVVEEELFADTEELEEYNEEKPNKKKKGKKEKKEKVVIEYEILINDFLLNSDGTKEPIERRLAVKDWKLREDDSASNPNEVYQLEIDTNKGPVFVYLSGSKKITKVDFGEVVYLMRGL